MELVGVLLQLRSKLVLGHDWKNRAVPPSEPPRTEYGNSLQSFPKASDVRSWRYCLGQNDYRYVLLGVNYNL